MGTVTLAVFVSPGARSSVKTSRASGVGEPPAVTSTAKDCAVTAVVPRLVTAAWTWSRSPASRWAGSSSSMPPSEGAAPVTRKDVPALVSVSAPRTISTRAWYWPAGVAWGQKTGPSQPPPGSRRERRFRGVGGRGAAFRQDAQPRDGLVERRVGAGVAHGEHGGRRGPRRHGGTVGHEAGRGREVGQDAEGPRALGRDLAALHADTEGVVARVHRPRVPGQRVFDLLAVDQRDRARIEERDLGAVQRLDGRARDELAGGAAVGQAHGHGGRCARGVRLAIGANLDRHARADHVHAAVGAVVVLACFGDRVAGIQLHAQAIRSHGRRRPLRGDGREAARRDLGELRFLLPDHVRACVTQREARQDLEGGGVPEVADARPEARGLADQRDGRVGGEVVGRDRQVGVQAGGDGDLDGQRGRAGQARVRVVGEGEKRVQPGMEPHALHLETAFGREEGDAVGHREREVLATRPSVERERLGCRHAGARVDLTLCAAVQAPRDDFLDARFPRAEGQPAALGIEARIERDGRAVGEVVARRAC